MKRSTIRRLGRLLPLPLRELAKRRLARRSIQEVDECFAVEESDGSLRCRINDSFSFLAPLACRNDLAHYTDSFEGRAEFAALVAAARDSGGILFDIGAHCGLISTLWCSAKSGNRVYSFEPSPALAPRLASIRDLNQFGDRMQLNRVGIGERPGKTAMLIDPVGGFVQSAHFDNTMWSGPESIEIEIESIEGAATTRGVIPDFIKLDIEGYEYEAIKGSAAFLARERPVVFLELHLNYLEERKISPRSVVEMLGRAGYSFFTYAGARLEAGDLYGSPLGICHVIAR